MYFKKFFTAVLLLSTLLSGNLFSAEETPDYQQILKEGKYEIRNYEPILVAQATGGNLFRTIADYIFGNNSRNEEIPNDCSSFFPNQKQSNNNDVLYAILFHIFTGTPKAKQQKSQAWLFDLGKVVVARFSGYNNYEKQQQVLKKLVKWAKSKNLQFRENNYFSAGYDSPWVPANQRTNEVLIRIK